MGVKYAVSLGADVTVFSTSQKKEEDAKRLGAQHFALSSDPETFKKLRGTFDFILTTPLTLFSFGRGVFESYTYHWRKSFCLSNVTIIHKTCKKKHATF
jgi:hypothetical protein